MVNSPRLALLADIHGNLAALEAVLADAAGAGATEYHSLGDAIGYGPQSGEVVELLAARGVHCLLGNHELGLLDPGMLGWFNPVAREALVITGARLARRHRELIATWPRFRVAGGLRLVHGCPPDSLTDYLTELDPAELAARLAALPEPLCVAGHTHLPALATLREGRLSQRTLARGPLELAPGARHLLNPGSVGQPRDGTPHAKYLLLDPGPPARAELRCVPYDLAATVRGIRAAGLPSVLADRLGTPAW